MKKLLFLLVATLTAVGLVSAAPIACVPPPPALDVLAAGFSYTCGGLTFSNFMAMPASPGFMPMVSLTMATYDPVEKEVDLTLNPNLQGSQDMYLWFEVAGFWVDKVDLAIGPSNASVTETVCGSSFGGSTICSQPLASLGHNGPPAPPVWASLSTPSNHFWVFKDIGAINGALSNVVQSYHSVPEPLTFILMGSGLLGLGLLRRRRA